MWFQTDCSPYYSDRLPGGRSPACRRTRRLPGGQSSVILAITQQQDVDSVLDAGADDCLLDSMGSDLLAARIAVAERAARRIAQKPPDAFSL